MLFPPVRSGCLRPPQSVWTGASGLLLQLVILLLMLRLCGAGAPRSSRMAARRGAGFWERTAAETAQVDHDEDDELRGFYVQMTLSLRIKYV